MGIYTHVQFINIVAKREELWEDFDHVNERPFLKPEEKFFDDIFDFMKRIIFSVAQTFPIEPPPSVLKVFSFSEFFMQPHLRAYSIEILPLFFGRMSAVLKDCEKNVDGYVINFRNVLFIFGTLPITFETPSGEYNVVENVSPIIYCDETSQTFPKIVYKEFFASEDYFSPRETEKEPTVRRIHGEQMISRRLDPTRPPPNYESLRTEENADDPIDFQSLAKVSTPLQTASDNLYGRGVFFFPNMLNPAGRPICLAIEICLDHLVARLKKARFAAQMPIDFHIVISHGINKLDSDNIIANFGGYAVLVEGQVKISQVLQILKSQNQISKNCLKNIEAKFVTPLETCKIYVYPPLPLLSTLF